jgi:hypothetical protein
MTLTRVDDRSSLKPKPVTKDLLDELFSGARITGGAGHFRITTPHSKVTVSPGKIKTAYPSEDVYRGVVLLVRDCWPGGAKVRGSREAMLACVAYGEAWGAVNIHADLKSRAAVVLRFLVAALIVVGGFKFYVIGTKHDHDGTGLLIIFAAMLVFSLLRWMGKRTEYRKAETAGFLYPRETQGNAKFASRDALKKGGLI